MAAAAPHLTATPTGVLKLAGHASLFALEQDMKVTSGLEGQDHRLCQKGGSGRGS